MNNYAAIAIGIDEYQFFQPLNYAKQNAGALENFLVEEAGFAPDMCLLLTPTSPQLNGHSTIPNRQNILSRIDDLCRNQLHSGDILWLFFSGYGAMWEGEDYLMPIDGNPADIPNTGISMRSLFTMLESTAGEPVLVLLDINRATSNNGDTEFGVDTTKLASEMELPTVLWCQPNQISDKNGLFAAALLEGLRSGECKTIDSLKKFLSDRLPQLCEQNSYPRQEPSFAINPSAKHNIIILPEISQNGLQLSKGTAVPLSLENGELNSPQRVGTESLESQQTTNSELIAPVVNLDKTASDLEATTADVERTKSATLADTETASGGMWVGKLAMGIVYATTAGLVVMLVIFTFGVVEVITQKSPAKQASTSAKSASPVPANTAQASQEKLDKALELLASAPASQYSKAIAIARQIPKDDPLYEQAQKNIDRWAMTIVDIAMGKAEAGRYEQAIATSKLVPQDIPLAYNLLQQLLPSWQQQYQLEQANQKRLDLAQKTIKQGLASSYSQAIAILSEISPDQPKYGQAREMINRYSDNIWAIAQNQARRRRITAAIQTATLVPEGTKAYPAARTALKQWQRQP